MQPTVRVKSAWASLLKPDFKHETSSTLMTLQINLDKGKKSFAINLVEVADDKLKRNSTIVDQDMENNVSYLNMKNFAEQH